MKKIVIINGHNQSGKDTVVEMASKYIPVTNVSSIDPFRNIPYSLGFEEGDKGEKYRLFLSELKKLSKQINNYPMNYIVGKIFDFEIGLYEKSQILFIHIREINEIRELLESYPNITTLLVKNPRITQITSNTSDLQVFDYKYEYTINNKGSLEDLECEVLNFIEYLKNK